MYVVSYFTDADEALHLAYSHDGEEFTAVNGGRPVLRGTVGTGRLRDPFIGVGPDGLFHLLATDGWTSPYIVHATSADLVSWSEQRLVPVMARVAGALNAWAPEFFLDRATGLYHLIWSSVVEPGHTAEGRDFEHISQDHRIWHCTTQDFRTYSAPGVFFDPGHSVIDATVRELDGGGFLMAFKDERGINDRDTAHKDIHLTTFGSPGGPYAAPAGPVTPSLVEGPALFRRGDEWIMIFDHFLEGRYGAARSRDGVAWEPVALSFPPGMRHASVLETSRPVLETSVAGALAAR
ncbi:family 43 glycosylhydrolase [Streptomyces sp. NPDC008092]|uniref:glycoside hydrolase family 43 protein n=1 Tax=Streptomyces sp. NPDC008092 TaxID=3364808 RepID=UPI0036E3123D